jgi:hypothetical protein
MLTFDPRLAQQSFCNVSRTHSVWSEVLEDELPGFARHILGSIGLQRDLLKLDDRGVRTRDEKAADEDDSWRR